MVGSIVVIGVLKLCALLHSVCYLKVELMNVQRSLIREIIHKDLKLGYNVREATHCFVKDERAVDYGMIIRWFEKFRKGCKRLDDMKKSGKAKKRGFRGRDPRGKSVVNHSERIRRTQPVKLLCGSSPSLTWQKNIRMFLSVPHFTKILQNI